MATAGLSGALAVAIWVVAFGLIDGRPLDWTIGVPAGVLLVLVFSVAVPGIRPAKRRQVASGKVVAVIPAFNETTAALYGTIWSLLDSTRPPDEIHVVDDGSPTPIAAFSGCPEVHWHRQPNGGKRKAQAHALRHVTDADYIVTVDSDCTLDRYAIQRLLQAMSDDQVQAATGLPLTRNRDSWLAKIIDLEIASICLTYRSARSMLGSLTTCSGALTMYRATVVLDNLDDYVGSPVSYGDDRRLTHYAMLRGRVASVPEAIVHTDMPTRLRILYRQRIRWSSSHWRYTPWELANLPTGPMLWAAYNLILSIIVPLALLWTLVVSPLVGYGFAWQFLAYWSVIVWLTSIKYAIGRPQMRATERWLTWLFGVPLLIVLQLLVLRPAHLHALLRLHSRSWGTRSAGSARGRHRGKSVPILADAPL